MNKCVVILVTLVATISFAQSALSATFHRSAHIRIVEKASGIKSDANGGLSLSGGGNNVQIAYLGEDARNHNAKVKHSTFNSDKKLNHSQQFTAQYE